MTFYCVKCREKKEVDNYETVTWKNGRRAAKAKCPNCGTGMYRVLPMA
jgi:predicted RNA-binding Zn-ribbon protein involved in translation (DUF1610 family)